MRFRSSGLGEKELKADLADLSPTGKDLLVLHIQTTEPVEWHLRAGMEFSDILRILRGFLKPSIAFFVLRSFLFTKKNPSEPEEF